MRTMFRTSILLLVLSALIPTVTCQELCMTQFGYEYFIQNILENTKTNTSIGHVTIFGTDEKIRLSQEPNDYFRFDNVTRNVTLVKELDTDRQAEEIPVLVLNCLILVPLDSRPISITVRVLVDDWNDNTPVFNRDQHHVNISEDTKIGSTVYRDAVASDNDKEFSPNSRISYRIVESDFSDYFLIPNPTKSIITLKESLDYESITKMVVLIEAKDNPSAETGSARSSTATLTVTILDADDQDPVFSSKETYRGKISEDASPGTVVDVNPSLFATDPDSMKYPIQYRLLDIYEVFEIDNTTAQIRTKRLLYDSVKTVTTVTVVVWASQVVNPSRETYTFLIININAANINAPRFSKNLYQVEKLELEPVGSVLVITTATDTDFSNGMGTTITYAIVETVDNFRVDGNGSLILQQPLDYEVKREWILQVTASDGSHTATTTVVISVIDVNDNNPVIDPVQSDILINREQGKLVTIVTATDSDRTDDIVFTLDNYKSLFRINNDGEIYIATTQDQLIRDEYNLQVSAHDSGEPPRKDSTIVTVRFPPLGATLPPTTNTTPRVAQAQVGPETDNMITIVLGALAGVLLIVIVILVIVLIIRQKRMKEALNRAREPKGYAAKGLTYRQAESPDDLPKMDLHYEEDTEGTSEYDGRTTIQNNPLNDHDDEEEEDDERINEGYLQSSVSDQMDREINEIEIETAVVPYDDDFGYPSGRSKYSGHMRTFQGEDTTSSGSAQSDSTGGSRRVLVNNDDKNGGNKLTSWDSDDKIHTQGADKLLDPGMPNSSKGGKPEITVYF